MAASEHGEVLREARERLSRMSRAEKRALVQHFRESQRENPAGASALLSVDSTAGMTCLVALLELGLISEETVHTFVSEESKAKTAAAVVAAQTPAQSTYSQYQLDLLKQVAALTPAMLQGLSPFQQQQLLTLQHMTRAHRR